MHPKDEIATQLARGAQRLDGTDEDIRTGQLRL
jgi:hypothetical protein